MEEEQHRRDDEKRHQEGLEREERQSMKRRDIAGAMRDAEVRRRWVA